MRGSLNLHTSYNFFFFLLCLENSFCPLRSANPNDIKLPSNEKQTHHCKEAQVIYFAAH